MWIGRSYQIEDVIALARDWNSRNDPPLDVEKVTKTCHSILTTHERNHGADIQPKEITPLFDLTSASVVRFFETEPPPRRWLLEDCLPIGKVGNVVARGGTGKSQLMLQLAISVATGAALADYWPVGENGKVLALFAEDDDDEIHRRLHRATTAMSAGANDLPAMYKSLRGNLYIKSMVAEKNLMTQANGHGEVVKTDYIRRLLLTLDGISNLKLIIVDPASRFRGGEENAAEDTTRFIEALEEIAKATGATVLVVHHVNKGSANSGEQTQEAARGSSALSDGARWQMNLAAMVPGEAKEYGIADEERGYYLTATITKNNYAAPQPKVILKRGDGGFLRRTELVSTKEQKTKDVSSKVVELVSSEAKKGDQYSKTSFEDMFGGQEKPLGIGKVALRKMLNDLVNVGKLVVQRQKLILPGRAVPKAKPATPGAISIP